MDGFIGKAAVTSIPMVQPFGGGHMSLYPHSAEFMVKNHENIYLH